MRIWFTDFWPGFDPATEPFAQALVNGLPAELSSEKPDAVIYSVFGSSNKSFRGLRIFYTGENVRPNMQKCDLALSFDFLDHPRHLRLPLYALHTWKFSKPGIKPLPKPERFCAFVFGNSQVGTNYWGNFQHGVAKRNKLLSLLSKYRQVDSAGTAFNNMGFTVRGVEKLQFIRNYKFTFAIENSSHPGYVTEKIVDPFMVKSVPIYWGSERVGEDFNESSFVNCHKFSSDEEIVDYLIQLDRDDALYEDVRKCSEGFDHSEYFDKSRVVSFIRAGLGIG